MMLVNLQKRRPGSAAAAKGVWTKGEMEKERRKKVRMKEEEERGG
jgi:hypothetical protein